MEIPSGRRNFEEMRYLCFYSKLLALKLYQFGPPSWKIYKNDDHAFFPLNLQVEMLKYAELTQTDHAFYGLCLLHATQAS